MRLSSLLLLLAFGCSCPIELDVPVDDAGAPDALGDVSQDSPPPEDAGLETPGCVGEPVMNEAGALSGTAFGRDLSLSFITGGIEPVGGHSCPRVFIRAGVDDDLSGFEFTRPYVELAVPYRRDAIGPGLTDGTLTWFFADGDVQSEEVMVNVTRADGLFENELPASERRIEFSLSHHDATTDFDAEAIVATYCNNFAMCI